MNTMAPDLSGLVPFMIAFFAIAAVCAVVCLAIIAHAAATFVLATRRTRAARRGRTASGHRVSSSEGPSPCVCV